MIKPSVDHAAGHAAVIELVDSSGLPLEIGAASAPLDPVCLLFLLRQILLPEEAVVVNLQVAVESDVLAVAGQCQWIDLRDGRVVIQEDVGQRREDGPQAEKCSTRNTGLRDDLPGPMLGEPAADRERLPPDLLRVARSELLDVDAALLGEDRHRGLAQGVVGNGHEELLGHVGLLLHQESRRQVATDSGGEELLCLRPGFFLGRDLDDAPGLPATS
jgi:hypothetical protein